MNNDDSQWHYNGFKKEEIQPADGVATAVSVAFQIRCSVLRRHREFILFSVLPVLAATVARRRGVLVAWQQRLQRVDGVLLATVPWVGRYCWETVIVLVR